MQHQIVLRRYCYCLTYELPSVLAFETVDDPHIQWLQMACAIWGKNITSIFFRAVVSLGYAAHWSMKSKIFLFFASIWHSSCTRNSSKVAKVIHELEFSGEFFTFLKQPGLLYVPVTSGGNFSVPSALNPSRTVTLCFDFVPPWQESPLYVIVSLGWRL